jgi:hypothetical protein
MDYDVKTDGHGEHEEAIRLLPGIGRVMWIDLIPEPEHHVVIHGAHGTITSRFSGGLWGSGRSTAAHLTELIERIGWDFRDIQVFYGLDPKKRYRMSADSLEEIATTVTPAQVRNWLSQRP